MEEDQNDLTLLEVFLPLLTGRYERLRDNLSEILLTLCVKDLSEDDYNNFTQLLIQSVQPVNKILMLCFLRKHWRYDILPKIQSGKVIIF